MEIYQTEVPIQPKTNEVSKFFNINTTDQESYKLLFKDSKFEHIYERLFNNKSFSIVIILMQLPDLLCYQTFVEEPVESINVKNIRVTNVSTKIICSALRASGFPTIIFLVVPIFTRVDITPFLSTKKCFINIS